VVNSNKSITIKNILLNNLTNLTRQTQQFYAVQVQIPNLKVPSVSGATQFSLAVTALTPLN